MDGLGKPDYQGEDRPLPPLTYVVQQLVDPIDDATEQYIGSVLDRSHQPYRELTVPKASGGRRTLYSPEAPLMAVQRAWLQHLHAEASTHAAAYAYRPGVSVVDCAQVHLRAHTVVRLDVADFFSSIRERFVFEALLELGNRRTSRAVSGDRLSCYQLALLATVSPVRDGTWVNRGTGARDGAGRHAPPRRYVYTGQREGFLPQGAPTSGVLSNMVMRRLDEELHALGASLGLRYTRYSDDLYFSSRREISHLNVDRLVTSARALLEKRGLRLNDKKTRVARAGTRREVLGILVDGAAARLPREVHRTIDLHLRAVDQHGAEAHAARRGFDSAAALDRHVSGLLSWLRHVEPVKGAEAAEHWQRSQQRAVAAIPFSAEAALTAEHAARESIDRLLGEGREYRRSADFAELLRFVGRFRDYSPFNAVMVRLQRRGARFVATEKRWRERYGRTLKPGAQSLLILQPGGPYMVVHDVGDTEPLVGAPPLPRGVVDPMALESTLTDDEVGRLWAMTVDNAVRDGVRVTLVDQGGHHAGRTYWTQQGRRSVSRQGPRGRGVEHHRLHCEVEVNRNLAPVDRYATLLHELAHIYCGHIGTPDLRLWPDRRRGTKDRNEVEAESITYMVMARLDPTVRMGDYLLGYLRSSEDLPADVALRRMVEVAGDLVKMGSTRLPARKAGTTEEPPQLFPV